MSDLEVYQEQKLSNYMLERFVVSDNVRQNYDWYVTSGRIVLNNMVCQQAVIGYYATMICQIRHGGHSDGYYTIKQYAEDLGMNPKTLNDWTAIYRRVVQPLGLNPEKMSAKEWKAARRVAYNIEYGIQVKNINDDAIRRKEKLFPDKEKIKQIYEENLDGPSFNLESANWMSYFKTIAKNIQLRDLNLANRTVLLQIMQSCDSISDHINDFLSRKQ